MVYKVVGADENGLFPPRVITALKLLFAPKSIDTIPSYVTGTHVGSYDRRRSLYNWSPSQFQKTRAKLAAARASTGLCRIAFWGDSITAGETAAPFATNASTNRFRDLCAALGYPIAGTGFVYSHNGASGQDTRISTTGSGWTQYGQTMDYSQTSGDTRTFTSDKVGTIVDVYYNDSNSGTFAVSIDGGANQTVNLGATSTNKVVSFTGLANTTHTVKITNTVAGYTVLVSGFVVRSATGLLVDNYGIGGSTTGDWSSSDPLKGVQQAITGPINPDLVVINLMANDVLQTVGDTSFKTNLQSVIAKAQGLSSTPEILLVANVPNGGGSDTAYRTRLYELADSNSLPLIDLQDRWGTVAQSAANGLLGSGNVHPTAAGYSDMGMAFYKTLIE